LDRKDIAVCILRVGGTNCDQETARALRDLGVRADVVHVNRVVAGGSLLDYDALVFPGGFSYGDHIRAGAVWAKGVIAKLGRDLSRFVEGGRPALGICNGFQVLVEAGFLPGLGGVGEQPTAALAPNTSMRYECRWVHLRHEGSGNCLFTAGIRRGEVLSMPVAHAEGRFILPREVEGELLRKLYDNDQLVLRYCDEEGRYAEGEYPTNPNGSLHDIAAICNPEGNVFGLMPHPERAYHGWQLPDWTARPSMPRHGDGRRIFEAMVKHLLR